MDQLDILQPSPSARHGRAAFVLLVGGDDMYLRIPLATELQTRGYQVGIAGTGAADRFSEWSVPYWRYSLDRGISPRADRRSRTELRKLFVRLRPDVVHAFSTKPAILAPLAAREAGVAGRVRTIAGMGYIFSSRSPLALALRPVYRRCQREASRAATVTIFQNRDDQCYFREHGMVDPRRDRLVLGSGVDCDAMIEQQPDETCLERLRREIGLGDGPVVTMVSRLVRYKGVLEFLEAARVVGRSRRASFVLIGPAESQGRQAVPARSIRAYRNDVHCLGPRNDVVALLAMSDIFVLPTYYREGIPRVLLEAAALGLPLVTTDMPGCREVVKPGENGLLVPHRNVGALVLAVTELLDSPARRTAMGRAGQATVRREFSLQLVADQYGEVYQFATVSA
jgi:glycosyltransferase involved in cell wall biosynthesis